ncbi:Rgg/GadR/MutR family transcriptional regulator [Marinilactibacillus kalidii]|uniref:Rgg/GadR/MutR family transcriptional regulator n=1 Tax=Marinilactibacillus kalidii TaxID=2820274 RepID=UPI001ABE1FB3|nr:Rgg/GadR/MutR family transcriptional regulator [Marinilactibacillus kalidii]
MYGQVFKTIRKSKGMTLKEAGGSILSVSQLSRFENGKSMIPVDLFFDLLNQINTTSEEFLYLKGSAAETAIRQYFFRIEYAVNHQKDDEMNRLKEEIIATRPAPYSWQQFILYFIESLEAVNEDKQQSNQLILDYLMQVEDWGEMELRLYAMFGFNLDVKTTHLLMRTALKRSKLYLAIPKDSKLLHTILSNNFSTFLYHNKIDYAEETIDAFERSYSENVDLLSPHIDFIFNKGLLALKKQQEEKGKHYCEQALDICRLFNQKSTLKILQKRYKTWLKKFRDPDFKELTINLGFMGNEETEAGLQKRGKRK